MSMDEKKKSTQSTGYTNWQTQIGKTLTDVYSPFIGQGVLGGLSDLGQKSIDMLRSADIWGPLTTAGEGLLKGTVGAAKILPEMASQTFEKAVVNPTLKLWEDVWKPGIKEEYAGPGYWGSSRSNAVAERAQDTSDWLGTQRANWMWNAEQANRAIDEAKAGRALSALGAVPSSLLGWTGGLFGQGETAKQILNQITDPQVLETLQFILNKQFAPIVSRSENRPSVMQEGMGWAGAAGKGLMALGGLGGGGAAGGSFGTMIPASSTNVNPYFL